MAVKALKTYIVSVPPRSSGAEIHAAILGLEEPHSQVQLMAASLGFATPKELCGLRALLEHAARHADTVWFDCPTDDHVHRYLARMDLYLDLPANVELSRPVPVLRRQDCRDNLIELSHIRDANDLLALLDRFWTVAERHFGTGSIAKAYTTALCAVVENVIDHADSPIGALVAAQRYERTGLELCVVDIGDGIPVTLRRNPEFAELSDLDAVRRALEDGVTSTGASGRGAGLAELCAAITRTGSTTLSIQSRQAHVNLSGDGGQTRVQLLTPRCPTPGTWISLRSLPDKPGKER